MQIQISDALVYENGEFVRRDFFSDLKIHKPQSVSGKRLCVMPGFADVHVHFREPGFSYKETIRTGSLAAAHGGYCAVCAMPNLNPVPDSLEHLSRQLEIIHRDACIRVFPYGAITVGERGEALAELEAISPYVCAFSDDGRGVQSEEMMCAAMRRAKTLGKVICAHCEDNRLLNSGYIYDGAYAKLHGHRGISSESEWWQIERDLRLARETGCAYHVCHISTKESAALIRAAKKEGLDVTCETAPHYLLMSDADLREDGNFKMNPPLRDETDRRALIEALLDGTIDMIATDHAPHSAVEKSCGLEKSAMGIVGLETAFALLYTNLVKTGILPFEKLIALMHINPCRRFGIGLDPEQNFTVFDLGAENVVKPERFLSMGRNTPFTGWKLSAACKLTVADGRIVWQADETED